VGLIALKLLIEDKTMRQNQIQSNGQRPVNVSDAIFNGKRVWIVLDPGGYPDPDEIIATGHVAGHYPVFDVTLTQYHNTRRA
jgi:hypothetical protein